jgi:AraC-like DNA-binding protein
MTIIFHQTLQTYGIDADAVFAKAGINFTNINSAEARLTGRQYAHLLKECLMATNDPNFVIKTARFIQPTCFNALGFALFSSRSIRKFLERNQRYYSFLTTTQTTEFVDDETEPRFKINSAVKADDSGLNRMFVLGSLIWINKMIQLMYGPHFRQLKVNVPGEFPDPSFKKEFEAYFDCPVDYSADHFSLVFKPEDLDTPLATANAALAQQNDEVILGLFARMAKADTPTRVRGQLLEMLSTGEYSKAAVARELGYSVRAFHNKLAEAGTSYQEILDETRLHLAEQYLRQETYSVGDVAFLLGFSDFSNFSRAFKKWTGETPTNFRIKYLGEEVG